MKSFTVATFIALLAGTLCANAQDKLLTVNGEEFNVNVFEVNKDIVRIERLRTDYTDIKYFPVKYVKSITFKDGFCVDFDSEGIPKRDNFLESPTMKCMTNGIYAEGLFRLNEEETMQLMGAEKYYSLYMPSKSIFYTGIAQIFTGGSALVASVFYDKKDVIIQNRKWGLEFKWLNILGLRGLENAHNISRFTGTINPYFVTAELFGTTTLVFGFVNFISARSRLKSALSPDVSLPSLEASKRRYWAGIGMTAAGVGSIVAGTIDMAGKTKWNWNKWEDSDIYSYGRYNVKEGTPPIAGPILVLAGSVLVNIGLHEFIENGARIKYFNNIKTGITQNGFGLSMTF